MNIGENIKKLRTEKGISQTELAQRVCVSSPMISMIERGTKNLTVELGKAIADALDCTINDLFDGMQR